MSDSVKIGGIGKNPAIDKINKLNQTDVKSYAVKKMEELLLVKNPGEGTQKNVPIDFSRANWKGKKDGRK